MATIITVHGTFAASSAAGIQWWQHSSDFEKDVHTYVQSDVGGPVEFAPFRWDGRNSECSRRDAARLLANQLEGLATKGKYHCAVGHSHGGSIIAHALAQTSSKYATVGKLSAWVAVATPFLKMVRRRLLLLRLFPIEQSIYMSLFVLFLFSILIAYVHERSLDTFGRWVIVIIAFVPFAMSWTIYRTKDAGRFRYRQNQGSAHFATAFSSRLLLFGHRDDEAIWALSALPKIRVGIFSADRLLAPLLFLYIFVAPLIPVIMLTFVGGRCPTLGPSCPEGTNNDLYSGIWFVLNEIRRLISAGRDDVFGFWVWFVLTAIVGFAIYLAANLILFNVFRRIAFVVAYGLGQVFNRITDHQVMEAAYGNDTTGLRSESCELFSGKLAPLPAELSLLITKAADEVAIQNLPELRRKVRWLIQTAGGVQGSDEAAEPLNWDELLHTTYFKVPMFRKLLCYAIAHSQGFRPSEQLKRDPDYDKLGEWLAEIRGKAPEVASTSARGQTETYNGQVTTSALR
jgi:hypothetical protein